MFPIASYKVSFYFTKTFNATFEKDHLLILSTKILGRNLLSLEKSVEDDPCVCRFVPVL